MDWQLPIVALAVLAVAAVSKRLEGTVVTAAMAFVAIGLLLGPKAVGAIEASPSSTLVRTLAEATLTIVLFTDAARIDVRVLRREYSVPLRLLGIGLPLTVASGVLAGILLLPGLTVIEAVVLAVVLAPTDAALGQAVLSEPRLPSRIRQGLNVESGLNDGICVPLLLIAIAGADVESAGVGAHRAVTIVAEEIGYGAGAGLAVGIAVSLLVTVCRRRDLIAGPWLQVIPVAAAALAYGTANALHGSGFIAAFVAGMLFGRLTGAVADEATRLGEELGSMLGGITFLFFGAVLLLPALDHLSWRLAAYATASLTVVRMAPVAVAMIGSGARAPTVGLLGWFGPRGLASIVFAVIVVESAQLPGTSTLLSATYLTIGLSVIAHGVSAAPLARRYVGWYESHPLHRRPAMESVPAPAHRLRGPRRAEPATDRAAGGDRGRDEIRATGR